MAVERRCPVCRAGFRGSFLCSRCGAALEPLMTIARDAWRLREAAREALLRGALRAALRDLVNAQRLEPTESGASLLAAVRLLEVG